VDYLINSAAVDDRNPVDNLTVEAADRMWQVNLRAYLLVLRGFLDLVRAGDGKSIVNIGTTNFMIGQEPFTLYAATKSGIVGFTRAVAREVGREGIRVNMISPGWIMTEKQLREHVKEGDQEKLLGEQSLKFLLYAEDVTPAVLFLLSQAARAITGQNLVVDGGKYLY
jgi:NAD(P)-dependent dehydrogenase (short-subunit alcohol dehydrogenase family)